MKTPVSSEAIARQPAFLTTHWTTVLTAGASDTRRGAEALNRLCQVYWYPLYVYVRRRGHSAADAQDLTQEFFSRLLERRTLAAADPARGRFRSFLLTAMNHFLIHEWEKAHALKRGGGTEMLSLDLALAESRYDLEPADAATPDRMFDRQWALALLNQVLDRLEKEWIAAGKGESFAALKQTLAGGRESQPYAELAEKLGMSEASIKVTVHRLRLRYRNLVRAEIANTVEKSEDIEAEMKHLFAALAGI